MCCHSCFILPFIQHKKSRFSIILKGPRIVRIVIEHWLQLKITSRIQFSCSVMSDFATPWTAARQASLSITNSQSLLKLISIESVMPSNHLILCRPLLLPPSIFPSIRVFSNESVLHIRWPKYWSFSFNISHYHPKSIVYIRVYSWYCTLHGF